MASPRSSVVDIEGRIGWRIGLSNWVGKWWMSTFCKFWRR